MQYKSHSDTELLNFLKAGDRYAFSEIHSRYWRQIYRHALKMIGDEDDAKDVVQELFAALWIKRESLGINTNLSGYLYISVRNRVINIIQQQKARNDYFASLVRYAEETTNITLEQISEKEIQKIIAREVQELPEKMRHVFELSRNQNLSHKEIASRLEISDKTVKKQIGYAIKIIRLRLDVLTRIIIVLGGVVS